MIKTMTLLMAMTLSFSLTAQDLPRPSPSCTVEQVVGLTTISLDYSRPSVKGRTIFGDLVPYGEIWRFGANMSTKLRTSTDMTFGGLDVKAGFYSVLCTPAESGAWKIHINSDTTLRGSSGYDEAKNVATVDVTPTEDGMIESMSLSIEDLQADAANFVFRWAKVKLVVPITVPTDATAEKNIADAVAEGENLDEIYYTAASYYYNTKKDEAKANGFLDKSLGVKENHRVYYLKGRMADDKENQEEAIKHWTKAVELAKAAESQGWADFIQGLIDERIKKEEK